MKNGLDYPVLSLKKKLFFLVIVGLVAFSMGMIVARTAHAQLTSEAPNPSSEAEERSINRSSDGASSSSSNSRPNNSEGSASPGSATLTTTTTTTESISTSETSKSARGSSSGASSGGSSSGGRGKKGVGKSPRIIYPKNSKVDFEGLTLQGEVRNPGEFYFQRRPEEKFDSLVKRRKNFHKEMLRDVVISK